jgi:nitrate/nitrite-specific signal transduction histidine kinase
MKERALRWQGTLEVERPSSGGTRVELSIPIDAIHEETAHDPSPDRR